MIVTINSRQISEIVSRSKESFSKTKLLWFPFTIVIISLWCIVLSLPKLNLFHNSHAIEISLKNEDVLVAHAKTKLMGFQVYYYILLLLILSWMKKRCAIANRAACQATSYYILTWMVVILWEWRWVYQKRYPQESENECFHRYMNIFSTKITTILSIGT